MFHRRLAALAAGCALAAVASGALAEPPGQVGQASAAQGDLAAGTSDPSQWFRTPRNVPASSDQAFRARDRSRAQLPSGGASPPTRQQILRRYAGPASITSPPSPPPPSGASLRSPGGMPMQSGLRRYIGPPRPPAPAKFQTRPPATAIPADKIQPAGPPPT